MANLSYTYIWSKRVDIRSAWTDELRRINNMQVEATAAKPFNIHESEPNLDRVHHDMMKDDNLLPENRWPCVLCYR
eukprot:COSAG06_NODE_14574_length_1146_cov_0.883477_1_plen_76_part_10